jgi:hypothetical protein
MTKHDVRSRRALGRQNVKLLFVEFISEVEQNPDTFRALRVKFAGIMLQVIFIDHHCRASHEITLSSKLRSRKMSSAKLDNQQEIE